MKYTCKKFWCLMIFNFSTLHFYRTICYLNIITNLIHFYNNCPFCFSHFIFIYYNMKYFFFFAITNKLPNFCLKLLPN